MKWTTWTIHDVIFFPSMMIAVSVVFWAHDHLRMRAPTTRITLGSAGLCLSFFIFFAIMRLLPKPETSDYSLARDTALIAVCSVFSGLLILSVMQILGGTIQSFQRWRYYRRNPR